MESEALRNIRTVRQVKTSLELARNRKVRTTNSLSRTKEEVEYLESLTDRRLGQVLAKERKRFVAQQEAVDKSRQRVLRSREKLAMSITRNRALTELRHELQRARWEGNGPPPSEGKQVLPRQDLRQIELQY